MTTSQSRNVLLPIVCIPIVPTAIASRTLRVLCLQSPLLVPGAISIAQVVFKI
jgi:hypothetical protein